jgi:phospholipid/cholesterol/gamma-HCH transport system substrate-binding protein
MRQSLIETTLGAIVLAVAIAFAVYAYTATDIGASGGYQLTASFDRIDGLSEGADVRIGGVTVGQVVETRLDTQDYVAVVDFSVNRGIDLPEDTLAEVASEGFLGGRYLSLQPGGSPRMLEAGEEILFTQSTPSLEDLLGQVIFSMTNNNGGDGGSDGTGSANGSGAGAGSGGGVTGPGGGTAAGETD